MPLIESEINLNASKDFELDRAVAPYRWAAPEVEGLSIQLNRAAAKGAKMGAAATTTAVITGMAPGDYEVELDLVHVPSGKIEKTQSFSLNVR